MAPLGLCYARKMGTQVCFTKDIEKGQIRVDVTQKLGQILEKRYNTPTIFNLVSGPPKILKDFPSMLLDRYK